MSILIKGMKMPKETTLISIGPGGTVEIHKNDDLTWVPLKEKAVPVPPHGRLIDADEIIQERHQHYEYLTDTFYVTVRDIELAPTIIEANKEE